MATAKFYLDTRKSGGDKKKPVSLKIAINHRSGTGFIVLNIQLLPMQWDKKEAKVVAHPQKDLLNRVAQTKLGAVNSILLEMSARGQVESMTATELCRAINAEEAQKKKIAPVRVDATNGSEFQLVKSPSKGMKHGRSPIRVKKSP